MPNTSGSNVTISSPGTTKFLTAQSACQNAKRQLQSQQEGLLQTVCERVAQHAQDGKFKMTISKEIAEKLWGQLQNLGYKVKSESSFLSNSYCLSWDNVSDL